MKKELYLDIGNESVAGSLYRITRDDNTVYFFHHYSTYDSDSDETKFFEKDYPDFSSFWQMLLKDKNWFYQHPLFVHPDERDFIQEQLKQANWDVVPDKKWQDSHQRQWKKVLTDPGNYYRG